MKLASSDARSAAAAANSSGRPSLRMGEIQARSACRSQYRHQGEFDELGCQGVEFFANFRINQLPCVPEDPLRRIHGYAHRGAPSAQCVDYRAQRHQDRPMVARCSGRADQHDAPVLANGPIVAIRLDTVLTDKRGWCVRTPAFQAPESAVRISRFLVTSECA